jgi:hypothetical protein
MVGRNGRQQCCFDLPIKNSVKESLPMATDEEIIKRRYREFLDLMPLTTAIAGLPPSEGAINFSADQMEVRSHTLFVAFKFARLLLREVLSAPSEKQG